MGINRTVIPASAAVLWNGGEVAEVRGLTPEDLIKILTREGETLVGMFEAFDGASVSGIDIKNPNIAADFIMEKAPAFLMSVAAQAPRFLATIIAVGSGTTEDDMDDDIEYIRINFSLPLQFECLKEIARLTFVGPEGFRLFVGNVSALAATVVAMTSAKTNAPMIQGDRSNSDVG